MKRALLVVMLLGCGGGGGETVDGGLPPDDIDAAPGSADAAPGPDAPPAACGLPAPGSRCASATTLERCDGAERETVDCAADGKLCTPDPDVEGGTTCAGNGDACGRIEVAGECAGSVLAFCEAGSLNVADCADRYGTCAFISDEYGSDCTSACFSDETPAGGACQNDDTIRRCEFKDGLYQVVSHTCPSGTTCQTLNETGWPSCLPDPSCRRVGPLGACAGETLVGCEGGNRVETSCAASGLVCAFGGDETGYVCAPPGDGGGPFVVSGTVRYEDRPVLVDGDVSRLGPRAPAAARGVSVAVVDDASGEVLAYAVTSDDGTYQLRYTAPAGAQVHVLAATTSSVAARPGRVIRLDGYVFGYGGPSFAAAATATQDLLVTDRSGVAEAFNIFDNMVLGFDKLRELIGVAAPEPLLYAWERGSVDGTYYSTDAIFLLGGINFVDGDDDGYDDAVILHELGHYFIDNYGEHDSSAVGDHDGTPTYPPLAFEEGFATYFSSAVRGSPYYSDVGGSGGWAFDLETTVTEGEPDEPVDQDVSEDLVSEVLWDVGDPADDDGLAGGHDKVLAVETSYLTTDFSDGGSNGIDLVDWLNGWFTLHGTGGCAGVTGIVVVERSFPYDFPGCP